MNPGQFGLNLLPPQIRDAVSNVGSAAAGNMAGRAATAGRNFQDVLDFARNSGFTPQELADHAIKNAQANTKFEQGVGMENLAFSRGINADQMRQQTYNDMAVNEQKNRFDAAKTLVDSYNQSRQATANLMANTLRF